MTKEQNNNLLLFGDNLNFLRNREIIPQESVDLIYLDPPFNSEQSYNVIFKEESGTPSAAQIKAFDDTWHWDTKAAEAYYDIIERIDYTPASLIELIRTLHNFLGHTPMLAYLVQMSIRLVEMHSALKMTGSIFLHCDPSASHYLKLILDSIFGAKNFRNEIVWHYRRWTAKAKRFQRLHDVIFFYTKSNDYNFNVQYIPYTEGSEQRKKQGVLHRFKRGEEPQLVSLGEVDERGVPDNDVWQIPYIPPSAKERLGYPTQKPIELLKKIILCSSNPGDVILDPFCGCGTTIDAVETINRDNPKQKPRVWIGIDITYIATNLIKHRLATRFDPPPSFLVLGEPESIQDASALAKMDRYQFQYWALGLIGARPYGTAKKKGADKGIDGVRYFIDGKNRNSFSILVQVKSGKVSVKDIRDFRGTMEREKAPMGVFITLNVPTRNMTTEAAASGFYHSEIMNKDYPAIQIMSIEELLKDKNIPNPSCFRFPSPLEGGTLKGATKHSRDRSKDQRKLF